MYLISARAATPDKVFLIGPSPYTTCIAGGVPQLNRDKVSNFSLLSQGTSDLTHFIPIREGWMACR